MPVLGSEIEISEAWRGGGPRGEDYRASALIDTDIGVGVEVYDSSRNLLVLFLYKIKGGVWVGGWVGGGDFEFGYFVFFCW